MKKLFFIALLLSSCNTTVDVKRTEDTYMGNPVMIIEYEGCEYVWFSHGSGSWGSHKGNCKNPVHKNNP
jgi:hypothetical protein